MIPYMYLWYFAILTNEHILKGVVQMQKQKWLPIIASVGVGAATYYSMTRKNQTTAQALQKMVPFMTGMGGNKNQGVH